MNDCDLKSIAAGVERLAPGHDGPRHRHLEAYAIVVLEGRFEQTSYAGRVRVSAGDLLIQPTLDCHENRMCSRGARILRLPWPDVAGLGGVFALRDLDAVVRVRDPYEAAALARRDAVPREARANDWPDELAMKITDGTLPGVARWAEQLGIARETVSRGFTRAYGVSVRRFQVELRARAAWLRVVRTRDRLVEIAIATGFADQAHMTRHVHALTGAPPAAWRRDARVADLFTS